MPWIVIVFIIVIVFSNLSKASRQQKEEQERRRRAAQPAKSAQNAPNQQAQAERMRPAPITTMKAPPSPTVAGAGGTPRAADASAQGGAPRVFPAGREGMRPSQKQVMKTTLTHVVKPVTESRHRHEESSITGFTQCAPEPAGVTRPAPVKRYQSRQTGLLDELRLDGNAAAKAILYTEILGRPKAKRPGNR